MKKLIPILIIGLLMIPLNLVASPGYEDFKNDYTELDPGTDITVSASNITVTDLGANEDGYVYQLFGTDYFDALDVDFEMQLDSAAENYGQAGPGFADTLDDANHWENLAPYVSMQEYDSDPNRINLMINRATQDYYTTSTLDSIIYMTLSRAAGNDTINLYIYNDSARANLADTVTVSGYGTAKWDYAYGLCSFNSETAGRDWDGQVQNMDLNIAVPTVEEIAPAHIWW